MKRILSLLLCLALLAGCGQISLAPPQSQPPTPTPTPTPVPRQAVLKVALDPADAPLRVLFDAYAAEQGVTIEYTGQETCDLAVLAFLPQNGWPTNHSWLAFDTEPLMEALCGMLEADPAARGLPLGQYGYGYLVNTGLLSALLGQGALEDLRLCTHSEWEDFCETVEEWIDDPDDTKLTLNGKTYTLPKNKYELTDTLQAVFVLADKEEACYGGDVLSYALAPALAQGQPLSELTADALAPGASALYDIFCLERESLYAPEEEYRPLELAEAEEAFLQGKALFYRADTLRGSVLTGQGMDLALIGLKPELDEDDISVSGLEPEAFYSRAVAGTYRWLTVNAEGDTDEAMAFAYWLYTSHQGQRLFTDTLGLVQNGLRSPGAEPGRTLAAWLEEDRTLPAFASAFAESFGDMGKTASLPEGGALLDGKQEKAYRQNLTDLLCPAE